MMNKDYRSEYLNLVNHEIPELMAEMSADLSGCRVEFSAVPGMSEEVLTDERGTKYVMISASCLLTGKDSSESIRFNVDLLKLPVFQELGFMIKGNYMQVLDLYSRTPGWHFTHKVNSTSDLILATANSINNKTFSFVSDHGALYMQFKMSSRVKKVRVPVATFLRAVTGMSGDDIAGMFGMENPFVLRSLVSSEEMTRNSCITAVINAVLGKSVVDSNYTSLYAQKRELERQFFDGRYLNFGAYSRGRMDYLQSFQYRASGKVLAETVRVRDEVYKEGAVLSNQVLQKMDASDINTLHVLHNGKRYTLHKFSKTSFQVLGCTAAEDAANCGIKTGQELELSDVEALNKSDKISFSVIDCGGVQRTATRSADSGVLTVDDLFTVYDIWLNNLNGFELFDKTYDLTNRIVVPYTSVAKGLIKNYLSYIVRDLSDRMYLADSSNTLMPLVSDYSLNINKDAFIDQVMFSSTSTGQMTDMCNIMSFMSKNNKAVSNYRGEIPDDMVDVQDLQNGRTDPFDVPESNKLALVNHRTLLADISQDGYLTSPYLPVRDGEVLQEEPVYLSAVEEANKYIAEWNETFRNEDGSKKDFVKARCNGDIVTVDIGAVNYKACSPYQSMSIAHSTIVFPGHSDGKRITMACNQETQALPLVNRERPYVNAGGESLLDCGFYYGRDVLERFCAENTCICPEIGKYRDEIFNAVLKLESCRTEDNTRILKFSLNGIDDVFKALGEKAPRTCTLSFPCLIGTSEMGLFTYNINASENMSYKKDDIIAYSNSCSLDNPEHCDLMDTGAQKFPEGTFDRGLSLVKNLNVGYKTFEGSSIDDAIVISDELMYGDGLTSITMCKITEQLSRGAEREECFGAAGFYKYDYFDITGLPRIGTKLNPGDPVISKLVRRNGTETPRYKYLKMYQRGQVVSARFKQKNTGEKVAEVILAFRATIETADKLAGRCGNKGVIARIVPACQMPYDPETGIRLQIVLNPLGIPSRQNLSQLLEVALSLCMKMDAKISYVSPYHKDDYKFVKEQMEAHGVHPRIFIDGRTGKPFERPINYGVISMYKLHHVANKRIHAIGMDAPVDPVFLQPRKGSKFDGGQSFGEMESWSLEGVGATKLLQDLYTVQSNDIVGKSLLEQEQLQGRSVQHAVGSNCNDAAMQACYRSLGVEFVTNVEEDCYEFKPLTDDVIRSLSVTPVRDRYSLHNPLIFGSTKSLTERSRNMYKWSYIELNTKIVLPIWVEKGHMGRFLRVDTLDGLKPLSRDIMHDIIAGNVYIHSEAVSPFSLYTSDPENSSYYQTDDLPETAADYLITGMSALVHIFENSSMDTVLSGLAAAIDKKKQNFTINTLKDSKSYLKLIDDYNTVSKFIDSGAKLTDYVVSTFPVMPQTYRPEFKDSNNLAIPDFDWHYRQILQAAEAVARDKTAKTEAQLYEKILIFSGLKTGMTKAEEKYQNILSYFIGKNKDKSHGKIRQNVESKRIYCSGRASIIPAADTTMKPYELGVPFGMVVVLFKTWIIGHLNSIYAREPGTAALSNKVWTKLLMYAASNRRGLFAKYCSRHCSQLFGEDYDAALTKLRKEIIDFIEGRGGALRKVVLAGRQPSLHKYAIRAYFVRVVDAKAINVHTLVCTGYNADFDGDQMWLSVPMTAEAEQEALARLNPAVDCINPKNSSIILKHQQDVALGVYCATMLKDNAELIQYDPSSLHYYHDFKSLILDIRMGVLKIYDPVCMAYEDRRYISTAGRLLFNKIVGGLTSEPFTNPLGITGIKTSRYSELKYDGIITCGKVKIGKIRYYNLQSICKSLYLEQGADSVEAFQNITEFGFFFSDRFSVSISLQDLDIQAGKDSRLAEANETKTLIERDFRNGLISAEDKKDAIVALYTDSETGIYNKVKKDIISSFDRNSNIFIMLDSGARGNEDQVMRMCGFLPQLQKDKMNTLEMPITNNFLNGLSEFDVQMTSFSVRLGLASTQNETPKAGYATHQVVFMTSGIKIVSNDCGKQDWWYDVLWGDIRSEKDRFMPNQSWFRQNLLGRRIAKDDLAAVEAFGTDTSGKITQASFAVLSMHGGFHSVRFAEGDSITVSINDMRDRRLLLGDAKAAIILRKQLNHGRITTACIASIMKHRLKQVTTEDGIYTFTYRMDDCSRSLLLHRQARNLPYLDSVYDAESSSYIDVITEETLQYIEDSGLDRVEARILLDCECGDGICAHCYGLKFSNLQFPCVGDYVGTEAAQAIGEPSAQLTISLVNLGGSANAAIDSGVAKFSMLLGGSVRESSAAPVARTSGYVHITSLDSDSIVTIERPEGVPGAEQQVFGTRIPSALIDAAEGSWINAGDPVTAQMVNPNDIEHVGILDDSGASISNSSPVLLRKKQTVWLSNYFDTFLENSILINARHFELLARIQNLYSIVVQSDNDEFPIGSRHTVQELAGARGNIIAKPYVSKRNDVILQTSGAMTSLAFENLAEVAAGLVTGCHKSYNYKNNALIGSIAIGANVDTGEIKVIKSPDVVQHREVSRDREVEKSAVFFTKAVQQTTSVEKAAQVVDIGNLEQELSILDDVSAIDAFSRFEPDDLFADSFSSNDDSSVVPAAELLSSASFEKSDESSEKTSEPSKESERSPEKKIYTDVQKLSAF